jgi:poly(hydroxyalkanoate) depolymerase family esterase
MVSLDGLGRLWRRTKQMLGGAATAPRPTGAFLSGVHRGEAGARGYKLYVPAVPAPARSARLLVMLHGCTQNPDDFALGTRMNAVAEARGWHVLYPRQSRLANFKACWNWFSPRDQTGARGEPAILAAMARAVMAERSLTKASVAGLSAGGAMALLLGAVEPDLVDTALSHSGVAPGAADDLASALDAMRRGPGAIARRPFAPRLMIVQGMADETVAPANADAIEAALGAPGRARESETMENGRLVLRRTVAGAQGRPATLTLRIEGLGHAWSGGAPPGSFVDPLGPDVSELFARFIED